MYVLMINAKIVKSLETCAIKDGKWKLSVYTFSGKSRSFMGIIANFVLLYTEPV